MYSLSARQKTLAIIALVGVAIGLRVFFSFTSLALLPATSDEASSVLLAKRISEGLRPWLFIAQPYQFPFESYLQALLVDWMPRNVIGARYQTIVLGWVAISILLGMAFKMFPRGDRWPAVLLILLPSAYWIQHQTAYTPPQYAMSALFTLLCYFAVIQAHLTRRNIAYFFMAGLFGGLAVSNHLVGLSPLASAVIVLLFTPSVFGLPARYLSLFAGVAIGVFPYLFAKLTIPGAYDAVDGTVNFAIFMRNLTDYAAFETIPGVMGIKPTLFPDIIPSTGWGSDLRTVFSVFYFIVLATVIAHRFSQMWREIRSGKMISARPVDVFILSSFATVGLFALSAKAGLHLYRFLLALVWCFPFIAASFIQILRTSRWRRAGVYAVGVYAAINLVTTSHMIYLWRSEGTTPDVLADTRDIAPVLDYLKRNDHEYCYATFWIAYRINMLTDEKIICSQLFNERFPGWGVPYKAEVDKQANTPVFALMSNRTALKAFGFMQHIAHSNISARHTRVGEGFHLYTEFTHQKFEGNRRLEVPSTAYRIFSAARPQHALAGLTDKQVSTTWQSASKQSVDTRLIVQFDEPTEIHEIKLSYASRHRQVPLEITVLNTSDENQSPILASSKHHWEGLIYELQKPVYRGDYHPIWLDRPTTVQSIEIQISEPNKKYHWVLSDILFATGDSGNLKEGALLEKGMAKDARVEN